MNKRKRNDPVTETLGTLLTIGALPEAKASMTTFCVHYVFLHYIVYVTPGANLTYLAPPGQFFMGAKSFIGTPEMQIIFVLKDKLFCIMKKMHGFHGNR